MSSELSRGMWPGKLPESSVVRSMVERKFAQVSLGGSPAAGKGHAPRWVVRMITTKIAENTKGEFRTGTLPNSELSPLSPQTAPLRKIDATRIFMILRIER